MKINSVSGSLFHNSATSKVSPAFTTVGTLSVAKTSGNNPACAAVTKFPVKASPEPEISDLKVTLMSGYSCMKASMSC